MTGAPSHRPTRSAGEEKLDPSQQPVTARSYWGAKWGIRFGLTFVVYAAIIFVLRGSASSAGRVPSFAGVATIYLCGGFVAGLIVGTLLPLTRWAVGAAAVGVIAAIPIYILVRLATQGFGYWATEDIVEILLLALLVGAPVGVTYRKIFVTGAGKRA